MANDPTVFVISTPLRDLREYRALAACAARLKRHGRVEINIGTLAEKSRHEIPEGGSPWHEYASYNPTPAKFFPAPQIAPFVPEDFVRKNRELLLSKAAILRELDLGAAFWSYEPNFLPEAFFAAYPHLRGPRTDHPRRSRREEFAPCVDCPETLQMMKGMMAELARQVPHLGTYYFKTNDAGPGLCWSDWQYSGANGPAACRQRGMGARVHDMLQALLEGACDGGVALDVHFSGNFSAAENRDIDNQLPQRCFRRGGKGSALNVGSMVDVCYPVRGIFDPLGILVDLQGMKERRGGTIFVDLRASYDRGATRLDVAQKIIEMIDGFFAEPAWGLVAMLQRLRKFCQSWVDESSADRLFEACVALHDAFKFKKAALPRLSAIYGGVSLRYITRPLVAMPERLAPDEEDCFLRHVFNVSQEEARRDYLDLHGSRQVPTGVGEPGGEPHIPAIDRLRSQLESVSRQLRDIDDPVFGGMSTSLRIYASIVRSVGNFYAAQVVRDRNASVFDGQKHVPPKVASWNGDADLQVFNEIQRDEFDNAQELLELIGTGGMDLVCHAKDPADEDTFLLGPDLVEQIRRKRVVMRRHWLDIQDVLATPHR